MRVKHDAPALKRVRFVYEVLCPVGATPENDQLSVVARLAEEGDNEYSGRVVSTDIQLLKLSTAKAACAKHGTDREFFDLPDFAVGQRVWWTDPDDGACSGWFVVRSYKGDTYTLSNREGSVADALGAELSERKPS